VDGFLNISASGPFTMPADGRGNFYSKAMAQLEYTHAVGGKALRFPECEAAPVTTLPETHFPEEMGSCQDGVNVRAQEILDRSLSGHA